jgi:hypothetical protein
MYRKLFDKCFEVFKNCDVPADNALICYGSPSGCDCNCVWSNGDFLITLQTPQFYGDKVLLTQLPELRNWLFNGRCWKQTTGFLNIRRIVPVSSPHFEWLNPTALACGFELSASPTEIGMADTALGMLTANDDWLSPQLRHDGVYEFVPELLGSLRYSKTKSLRLRFGKS